MNTEDIFRELQNLQRPFLPQHLNFEFNVLNSTINNGFVIHNIEEGGKKSRSLTFITNFVHHVKLNKLHSACLCLILHL